MKTRMVQIIGDISSLLFYKDVFGIKKFTKVDILWKKLNI